MADHLLARQLGSLQALVVVEVVMVEVVVVEVVELEGVMEVVVVWTRKSVILAALAKNSSNLSSPSAWDFLSHTDYKHISYC